MANLEEVYSTSLDGELYSNEMVNDELFKTVVVTEEELLRVKAQFDPDVYVAEAARFKEAVRSKVRLLTTLKADMDAEQGLHGALQAARSKIEWLAGSLDISDVLEPLRGHIDRQDERLKDLQETYDTTKKELCILHRYSPHFTQNDPRHLCPVCLGSEVNVAVAPCGHTLCNVCCFKLDDRRCFICRNDVQSVIKLYFN